MYSMMDMAIYIFLSLTSDEFVDSYKILVFVYIGSWLFSKVLIAFCTDKHIGGKE